MQIELESAIERPLGYFISIRPPKCAILRQPLSFGRHFNDELLSKNND